MSDGIWDVSPLYNILATLLSTREIGREGEREREREGGRENGQADDAIKQQVVDSFLISSFLLLTDLSH